MPNAETAARPAQNTKTQLATRPQAAPGKSVLAMPTEQWNRMDTLAERAHRSGVLPKAVDSKEKAFIIALKGYALSLDPLYAMEHMSVINGKACIDGQAMLALIYRAKEIEVSFPATTNPAESCRVKMKRRGAELEVLWTIERAKKAGLLSNSSWQKYPDQMLRWRAIAECARVIAPDVIGGLYLHEELGANVNDGGEVIEAEFTAAAPATTTKEPGPAASPQNVAEVGEPPARPEVSGQWLGSSPESEADPGLYVCPIGNEIRGKKLKEIPLDTLVGTVAFLEGQQKKGQPVSDLGLELLKNAKRFLDHAATTERAASGPSGSASV